MTRAILVLFLCTAGLVKAGDARAADSEEARKAFFVGASMVDAGEHAEAVPWLEQALEHDPGFCRAHFYLALCYAERGTADGNRDAIAAAERYEACATDAEAEDVTRLWGMMPERSSAPPPPTKDDGSARSDDRDDGEQFGRSDGAGGGDRDDDRDEEERYGRSGAASGGDRGGDDRDDRRDDGSSRDTDDRDRGDKASRSDRAGDGADDDDYRSRRYGRRGDDDRDGGGRDDDRGKSSRDDDRAKSSRDDDRGKSSRDNDRGKSSRDDDRGKSRDSGDEEEDEFAYLLDMEEDGGGSSRRDDDRDSGYRPSTGSVDVRVDRVPAWKKRKIAGGIIMGVGAGAAAGGFVMSAVMYRTYYWEADTALYGWARNNTIAGTAIGIGGAAAALTGFVVMVATRKDSYGALVIPGPVTTFTFSFR